MASRPRVAALPGSGIVTEIVPATGWQLINVRELWQARELLMCLVWRDVKVRYKQTALGAAWAILQPAMMMVVFTVFFGRLAKVPSGDIPYPLFVFSGLLPWTFFSTAISQAGNSVVASERLVSKVYFPRLAVPMASVGAALVDFMVAMTMLAGMMIYYQVAPQWGLLLIPMLVALCTIGALGVGALLAALNVAYRDFRYVIPFMVQLWMFATPTVYMQPDPTSEDRGWLQVILHLNPMTGLISFFRSAMLGGELAWTSLGFSTLGIVAMFVVGCLYFRKVEGDFADII